MLSAAGVQRSGTPAESKHPYKRTTAADRLCRGALPLRSSSRTKRSRTQAL